MSKVEKLVVLEILNIGLAFYEKGEERTKFYEEQMRNFVYKDAKECLIILSEKVKERSKKTCSIKK